MGISGIRRVDATLSPSMQVTEFDQLKVVTSKSIDSMLERYTQLDATFFGAQSRAAVEVHQRAANAAHKELHTKIEKACASMLESSHMQLTEIVHASERCVSFIAYFATAAQHGVCQQSLLATLLTHDTVFTRRVYNDLVGSVLVGSDREKWF